MPGDRDRRNTAAFTLVNGLLLRPLPFDDPAQLVMVALRDPVQHGPRPFALREYRELAAASAPTIQLFARTFFPLSLAAGDGARMTMGLALRDGRGFSDLESRDGRTAIVDETLARRLWPRERAVGHRVRIDTADAEPFDIIGGSWFHRPDYRVDRLWGSDHSRDGGVVPARPVGVRDRTVPHAAQRVTFSETL